jgi:hypothetical protein
MRTKELLLSNFGAAIRSTFLVAAFMCPITEALKMETSRAVTPALRKQQIEQPTTFQLLINRRAAGPYIVAQPASGQTAHLNA